MFRRDAVRVLIAEDDQPVREALVTLVELLGHAATAVRDGAGALDAVSACRPDLVLSDIRMPAVSGLELCRRLKANPATHQIPVVLITALGEEHRRVALAAGADGFLNKPFGIPAFRAQIEMAMSGAREWSSRSSNPVPALQPG
jgi:CheY-like chemotaxis protein